MKPFILDTYNLAQYPGTPNEQLVHMMQKILTTPKISSHQLSAIVAQYTHKQRLQNFHALIASHQQPVAKILLVTDFSCRL